MKRKTPKDREKASFFQRKARLSANSPEHAMPDRRQWKPSSRCQGQTSSPRGRQGRTSSCRTTLDSAVRVRSRRPSVGGTTVTAKNKRRHAGNLPADGWAPTGVRLTSFPEPGPRAASRSGPGLPVGSSVSASPLMTLTPGEYQPGVLWGALDGLLDVCARSQRASGFRAAPSPAQPAGVQGVHKPGDRC